MSTFATFAFEEWNSSLKSPFDLDAKSDGTYLSKYTRAAFEAWNSDLPPEQKQFELWTQDHPIPYDLTKHNGRYTNGATGAAYSGWNAREAFHEDSKTGRDTYVIESHMWGNLIGFYWQPETDHYQCVIQAYDELERLQQCYPHSYRVVRHAKYETEKPRT